MLLPLSLLLFMVMMHALPLPLMFTLPMLSLSVLSPITLLILVRVLIHIGCFCSPCFLLIDIPVDVVGCHVVVYVDDVTIVRVVVCI